MLKKRYDALLGFNGVLLDIDLTSNAKGVTKDKSLALVKEMLLILLAARVELSVDDWNSYADLLPGTHQSLEISVASAKGICCCIAPGHRNLELLKNF